MLAFLIITIFTVAGKYVFELFGITLPAFRITGGILVFQIGLNMLQGEQSKVQQPGDGAADKSRAAKAWAISKKARSLASVSACSGVLDRVRRVQATTASGMSNVLRNG